MDGRRKLWMRWRVLNDTLVERRHDSYTSRSLEDVRGLRILAQHDKQESFDRVACLVSHLSSKTPSSFWLLSTFKHEQWHARTT